MPASRRILVVERRPYLSGLMQALMRTARVEVDAAADVATARDAVLSVTHAGVIVQLDVSGGLDLCRWLRAQPPTRNVILVAVDQPPPRSVRADALGAGCDLVVSPPVDPFALAALLEPALPYVRVDDGPSGQ